MAVERFRTVLDKISESLKGTAYVLKVNEQHLIKDGFVATIFYTRPNYPAASLETNEDGNLVARKYDDIDPIPLDLVRILEKTELKSVEGKPPT
jgi:predicted choloylglycine hydrolase